MYDNIDHEVVLAFIALVVAIVSLAVSVLSLITMYLLGEKAGRKRGVQGAVGFVVLLAICGAVGVALGMLVVVAHMIAQNGLQGHVSPVSHVFLPAQG
jgi:hypothetical protein